MARYQRKGVWRQFAAMAAAFGMVVGGIGGLSGCGNGSGGSRLLANAQEIAATPAAASASKAPSQPVTAAGCSLATYAPNFGSENDPATGQPNRLLHWRSLPAHVYFVPGQYLTDDRKAQALAGFGWWGQALGVASVYQEVSTPSAANIIVQFETRGETNYGAITEYHFDSNQQLLDATMTFNMTYLANIGQIAPVAAHEFGHALGIAGHSNDHGDVMSSSADVYQMTGLSTRDINTMKTAYCGLPLNAAGDSGTSNGTSKAASKGVVQTIVSILCGFGLKQ